MRGAYRLRVVLLTALLVPATGLIAARPPLIEAVRNQDRESVRALLKQGVDVNEAQPDGATALHWSVYQEDLEMVDLLLAARADVNAANDLGVTPLVMACTSGNGAIVSRLLAAGANPHAALPGGETALMWAARSGSLQAVSALLAGGAVVNARERAHGQTALMWAVANNHSAVTRALVDRGADVAARSETRAAVFLFGANRTLSVASPDTIAETRQGGSTPLLFAARSGDLESARILVGAGANVNDTAADGNTALVIAAHSGHGSVAALLLEEGADANAAPLGYTALHAAVLRGALRERDVVNTDPGAGVNLIKALLAHGANPNANSTAGTPVRRGSQDFILSDRWIGATPFWLAARFLEIEMAELLAAAGASPNRPTRDGTTPLMAAAGVGYSRGGGDTSNIRDRRDLSHYNAVASAFASRIPDQEEARALQTVERIITWGAEVNAANSGGDTALHGASALGMNTVVRLLAARGANLNAINRAGRTPLNVASRDTGEGRMRRESTADVLRALGAEDERTPPARRRQ